MPTTTNPDQYSNFGSTTLAGGAGGAGTALGVGDTTMTVTTPSALPTSAPFPLVLTSGGTNEIVRCTAIAGSVYTIARAQEGTTAHTFTVGSTVASEATAASFSNLWKASPQVYNVMGYGAKGDGATNDATAIQAAINAANTAGGGTVYFPAATYIIGATLIQYSAVHWRGAGVDATILQAAAGLNNDVVQTASFLTLTGTNNDTVGVKNWSMRDLVIDGNKASNTSGYGMRIYGCDYTLENMHFRNCANDGLYSEFATASNEFPASDSLESRLKFVKAHDNLGHGITWAGPHDSLFSGVITYLNGTNGDGHAGIYVKNNTTSLGGRLQISDSHSWGNSQSWALKTESSISTVNNQWEGAQSAQVLLTGSDATHTAADSIMIGDTLYTGGSVVAPVGIEIGAAAIPVAGLIVRGAKFTNLTSGALKFTNDGGLATIDGWVYQTTGTAVAGTPASSTYLSLAQFGSGNSQTQVPGHVLTAGSTPALGALQTGITSQSISGNDTCGLVTLTTTGTPPGVGATIAVITFAAAYAATPHFFLSGGAHTNFAWTGSATTGFSIYTTAALSATTTYFIDYLVIG